MFILTSSRVVHPDGVRPGASEKSSTLCSNAVYLISTRFSLAISALHGYEDIKAALRLAYVQLTAV
jgi:hypothetical protein